MSNLKSKTFESYTLEDLSEKSDFVTNYLFEFKKNLSANNKTWEDAYKVAAYYFDHPDNSQRNNMFKRIRGEFSNLWTETNNEYELPEVNSRNQLLMWVCKKQNESLKKSGSSLLNCNVQNLRTKYGPNENEIEKLYHGDFKMSF